VRRGWRGSCHTWVDGLNEQQIHDRGHLADIVAEWAALHGVLSHPLPL
jgi:hypothetical protein